MAQPRLQAEFFGDQYGNVLRKAPPLSRRDALSIYRRDGGVCQSCGERVRFGGNRVSPFDEITSGCIDHIFPRARGGQNDPANLRLTCITCNARKGAK